MQNDPVKNHFPIICPYLASHGDTEHDQHQPQLQDGSQQSGSTSGAGSKCSGNQSLVCESSSLAWVSSVPWTRRHLTHSHSPSVRAVLSCADLQRCSHLKSPINEESFCQESKSPFQVGDRNTANPTFTAGAQNGHGNLVKPTKN